MKRHFLASFASLIILLAIPTAVMAHGSMFTFKQIDGPNLVLVTHNVHDPQSGIPIRYNLRLTDMTGQPVLFTTIETEFKLGSKSLDKQTLQRSENNDAMLTFSYPKKGEYTLIVRFMDGDKQVAAGDFPIVVAQGLDDSLAATIFSGPSVIGFLAGLAVGGLLMERGRIITHSAAKRKPTRGKNR